MKTPEKLWARYLELLGREQDNQIIGSPGIGFGFYSADECKRLAIARLVAEEVEAERAMAADFVDELVFGAIPGAWSAQVAIWIRAGKHVEAAAIRARSSP